VAVGMLMKILKHKIKIEVKSDRVIKYGKIAYTRRR
jgi:hypothetical protein